MLDERDFASVGRSLLKIDCERSLMFKFQNGHFEDEDRVFRFVSA